MKWLRKKIINWLFGVDYISYEELFDTYKEVYKAYEENYEAYKNAIKYFESIRNISNDMLIQNTRLLHICDVLIKSLKENGIDVDKIDFSKEV